MRITASQGQPRVRGAGRAVGRRRAAHAGAGRRRRRCRPRLHDRPDDLDAAARQGRGHARAGRSRPRVHRRARRRRHRRAPHAGTARSRRRPRSGAVAVPRRAHRRGRRDPVRTARRPRRGSAADDDHLGAVAARAVGRVRAGGAHRSRADCRPPSRPGCSRPGRLWRRPRRARRSAWWRWSSARRCPPPPQRASGPTPCCTRETGLPIWVGVLAGVSAHRPGGALPARLHAPRAGARPRPPDRGRATRARRRARRRRPLDSGRRSPCPGVRAGSSSPRACCAVSTAASGARCSRTSARIWSAVITGTRARPRSRARPIRCCGASRRRSSCRCERWADEDAAAVSARSTVATALARVMTGRLGPAVVLAAGAGDVATRIGALSAPAPRPARWSLAAGLVLLAALAVTVAVAMHDVDGPVRARPSRLSLRAALSAAASEHESRQATRLGRRHDRRRRRLDPVDVPRRGSLRGRVERRADAFAALVDLGRPPLCGPCGGGA